MIMIEDKFPLVDYKSFLSLVNKLEKNKTNDYFKKTFAFNLKKLIKEKETIECNYNYYINDKDILVDDSIHDADIIRNELLRPLSSIQGRSNMLVTGHLLWDKNDELSLDEFITFTKDNSDNKKYLSISEYNTIISMINIITGKKGYFESIEVDIEGIFDIVGEKVIGLLNGLSLEISLGSIDILTMDNFIIEQGTIKNELKNIAGGAPGKDYYFIGYDSTGGSGPAYLFINVKKDGCPVYKLDLEYFDDPAKPFLLCDSFEKYMDCLKVLKEYEEKGNIPKKVQEVVKNKLLEITKDKKLDSYWEGLIGDYDE